jgi:hypothetical protein
MINFVFLFFIIRIYNMTSSPTKDLLERIDRLHLMLTSELPTIPLSRITINSTDPLIINHGTMSTYHSNVVKSESMIIDELQQYIKKMEREREILLRSYSIILQLLKHNDLEIEHDYSELFHND